MKYNLKFDEPDKRDKTGFRAIRVAELPKEYEPDFKELPEPYDQGNLGSCTSQATIAMIYRHTKFQGSRLQLYYNQREIDGTINEDAGSTLRTAMKAANKLGVCDESVYPYYPDLFRHVPTIEAKAKAKYAQRLTYERVPQHLLQLKSCLAQGLPITFGFCVYDNFETTDFGKNPIMPMPKGEFLGRHAILAVGYSDKFGGVWCRNSWGKYGCYFLMPYKFITDTTLCADFWTITNIKNDNIKSNESSGNGNVYSFFANLYERAKRTISNLLHS